MSKQKGAYEQATEYLFGPIVDERFDDLRMKLEESIKNNTPFDFKEEFNKSLAPIDELVEYGK